MNVTAVLLDAKKALGVVAVTIPAVVGAGVIDNAQAATITGVVGALTTVVVYLMKNESKAKPAPAAATPPAPTVPPVPPAVG